MVSDGSSHTQSDVILLMGVCLSPSPGNRLILQMLESSPPGSLPKLPGSWWLRCAGDTSGLLRGKVARDRGTDMQEVRQSPNHNAQGL